MSPRRCLTLALATACLAVGAAPAADAGAACRQSGHRISERTEIDCRAAKSVLSGWLGFGAIDGAVSGPAGLGGVWKCWGAKRQRLGTCKRTMPGKSRVLARFRFT